MAYLLNFNVVIIAFLYSIHCANAFSFKWNKVVNLIQSDVNKLRDHEQTIMKNLRIVENKVIKSKGTKESQSGCSCQKATYTCGCCLHMEAEKIYLNDTGCVNVSYLPDQYGISLTFSLDGKVVFNQTVSARNPPPLCFAVPYLKAEASLCIDFYNLDLTKSAFSGCVKVQARLVHIIVQDFDLGCFKIPLSPHKQNLVEQKEWLLKMQNVAGERRKVMLLQN